MTHYFAYGSNMSADRMKKRLICFKERKKGILKDFSLVFNKIASANPGLGRANIVESEGSIVEGVIYDIGKPAIILLDIYEGVKTGQYHKETVLVEDSDGNEIECFTYIADRINEELKPDKKYLQHLLDAKDMLSEEYFKSLKKTETAD